jgi:hypothetical protein
MSGAPEHYRMPRFLLHFIDAFSPFVSHTTTDSYQPLARHTERKRERERSKPRFHSRFVHAVGPIARRIRRRTVGFRVSPLQAWYVTITARSFLWLRYEGAFSQTKGQGRFLPPALGIMR